MKKEDTISAVATALGESSIGIIRISGDEAISVADRVFKSRNGKRLYEIGSYRAIYGNIESSEGGLIDEAIALVMRAPNSYTREDVVELQCHGGARSLMRTLSRTYEEGARPAERGEFTKRAFLNGRIDLSQAQAVMDVIQAKTDSALSMASGNLSGKCSKEIKAVRQRILGIIAHLEAVIDFPEDDLDSVAIESMRKNVVDIINELNNFLKTARAGKILREGWTTAIIGKPNVGKSSLLNMLLRTDRAIVTEMPGTTRDSIEEYADVGGVPLHIIDTAGIRNTEDIIEKIGVEKSRAYAEQAGLVLAIFDGSQPLSDEDEEIISILKGKEVIILINKSDLEQKLEKNVFKEEFKDVPIISISTKTQNGLESLQKIISEKAYGTVSNLEEMPLVRDERESNILRRTIVHLQEALQTIDNGMGEDFISIDLRSAWEVLGEFTGEAVGEDIIDEIFSRFCIGK